MSKMLENAFRRIPEEVLNILTIFKGKRISLTQKNLNLCKGIEGQLASYQKRSFIGKMPKNGIFQDLEESLQDQLKLKSIISEI